MGELKRITLPFTAIVGLEQLKLALLLNGVNPSIGGVLISGPKGTGKTTVVRALADLLPEVDVVKDCRFGCNPSNPDFFCEECRSRVSGGAALESTRRKMRVVNLPLSTTEDRLIGALDIEQVLREGIRALKPGILADAHQNVLYVDEVNLLPDHLVDDLLDAAATKVNTIEREGISISHPSDFVLIGTMNPEEGELRPQLLDRFALHVAIGSNHSIEERMELVRRNLEFERDPDGFREDWSDVQQEIRERIVRAKDSLENVELDDTNLRAIAMACDALEVDGVRPDIVISKTAITHAAFQGRTKVTLEDMKLASQLALSHRTRRGGLLEPPSSGDIDRAITKAVDVAKKNDRRKSPTEIPKEDEETAEQGERRSGGRFGRQSGFAQFGRQEGKKKTPGKIRRPEGNPIKGTICAVMMVVSFSYFLWIYASPVNWLFGSWILEFPPLHVIIIDTIIYIPLIWRLVRKWLEVMTRRKSGPTAGIDTVEPGRAMPESGDEWGLATRPYVPEKPSIITGPKSDIRESPFGLDDSFFVKMPDIDTGEEIFDGEKLRMRAMIRSRVTTGNWINKRVSSRAFGSLKSTGAVKHGRPIRSRMPAREIESIHVPSTVMAAIVRTGHAQHLPIRITRDDLRENMFAGKSPLTIILVIDVSLSMKGSMEEVRQLLERIEGETRGSKDRTGIIAFKDSGAVEVQAPTTNWNKIYRVLGRLRISGLTPLADALRKAFETIQRERMRNPDIEPFVIVISDFSPNIPLAQSVGPGDSQYTPVQDLIRTSRMLRKAKIRMAAINVDPEQSKWPRFLERPYHEALELAAMLRARKDGLDDPIEAVLSVDEFRRSFGAYLVAKAGGGRAHLSRDLMKEKSILRTLLLTGRTRSRFREEDLREIEAYLPK